MVRKRLLLAWGCALLMALGLAPSAQAEVVRRSAPPVWTWGTTDVREVATWNDERQTIPFGVTWREVVSGTATIRGRQYPLTVGARSSGKQSLALEWEFPEPIGSSLAALRLNVQTCTVSGPQGATCVPTGTVNSSGHTVNVVAPGRETQGSVGTGYARDAFGTEDTPLSAALMEVATGASFPVPTKARIDWGDGTSQERDLTHENYGLMPNGRTAVGWIPHTFAVGTHHPRISVALRQCTGPVVAQNCYVEWVSVTTTVVIEDVPVFRAAPITATEGEGFDGRIGDVDHTCPECTYSATVDWGDGTREAAQIETVHAGFRKILGSHTWAEEGQYEVEVTLTINRGGQTIYREKRAGTATVSDAPLFASQGYQLSTVAGVSRTLTIGHLTDANPRAKASDYQVLVDWGDGRTSMGSVVKDPESGEFFVRGTHAYSNGTGAPITRNLRFKVRSDRGQETEGTATVTVHPHGP